MNDPIIFTITTFTIFLSSIFVTIYVKENNEKNIIKSKIKVYPMAYVISEKNSWSEEKLNEIIFNMFTLHKMNCQQIFCGRKIHDEENIGLINSDCKICNESEYSFETFLTSFYLQTKLEMKTNKQKFSEEENELFFMIELFYLNYFKSNQIIKLYFKIVKIQKKSFRKSKNLGLLLNISRIKTFVSRINFEETRLFKIFKGYEETSSLMKKVIDISDEIYTFYEAEIEIYKKAEKINIARKEILKYIQTLNKISCANKSSENLYNLILLKNIYEEIFNTNIDNIFPNSDEMIEAEYKISHKFKNDKIMIVNYNVENNSFFINKVSGDLKIYNKMNFENIFHLKFKSMARKKFLKIIKEKDADDFTFEFIIKNQNLYGEMYLQNAIFKGKVFPSFDFNEFIINMKYEISNECLIMFEQNNFAQELKCLKGMSKNVENILNVTEVMVRNLDEIRITFDDIFIANNQKSSEESEISLKNQSYKIDLINEDDKLISPTNKHLQERNTKFKIKEKYLDEKTFKRNEDSTEIKCQINLHEYIRFCFKLNATYNPIGDVNLINFKELERLIDFDSKLNFILSRKYSFKTQSSVYDIYSIISHDLADDSNDNSSEHQQESELHSFSKTLKPDQSSPSVLSYVSGNGKELKYYNNTKVAKKSKNNTVNLNRVTTFISAFIFFLILYNSIFMIIGVLENQKMDHCFANMMSFIKLEKAVYQSYSIMFNKLNLGIYNPNLQVNKNEIYNYKLINMIKTNINIVEIDYLNMNNTINSIQQGMLDFEKIYQSSWHKAEIDLLLSNMIEYKIISQVNGGLSVFTRNQTLFDSISTLMNLARIIFENDEKVELDRFNYILDEIDFSSLHNKNYTDQQLYGIEIIINFLNICNQAEIISNSIQNMQNQILNSIYFLTFIIFITFVLFHIFIVLICVFILRILTDLILNYLKIMEHLFNDQHTKYMKKKLSILKVLNELYAEDPAKLLINLKENKNKFRKTSIAENRKLKQKKSEVNEHENNKNDKSNVDHLKTSKNFQNVKSDLITPIKKKTSLMFILLIVYSSIFYYFISVTYNKFVRGSLMFTYTNMNGNFMFKNYNSLQFMFYTKNSDQDLFNLLTPGRYGEQTYIKSNIYSTQRRSINITNIMKVDSNFRNFRLAQPNMMNCTYLYSNLNDQILNAVYTQYGNGNNSLENILIHVCKSLPVMKTKMVQYIVEEVNYNMQKVLFDYISNINDDEKVIEIYNEPSLFYLYYLLVYIYRPIQQYASYSLVYPVVVTEEISYMFILLLFLGLNILVDITIFIFIKTKIINRILYISSFIEHFIDLLRVF